GPAEPTLNCAIRHDRSVARREDRAGPTASAVLLGADKRSPTGQSRGSRVTMGSMSASDAAPLPRLGEVYFDVRGESRSMRLSWYADTGVAVFSIWQGGTCTGTFRLPIADLPRMVEALQRGPHGDARGPADLRGAGDLRGPGDLRGAGDARGTAEQHGRAGQHGAQARGPGPVPDTGYSGPGSSTGHVGHPAGYGAEPARDYPDRGGGYPAPAE